VGNNMSYKIFNEHSRAVNNKIVKGDASFVYKMKTVINENVLRVALLAFNFIFLILSISLIALAIAYTQQLSAIKWYIGSDFISFPAVLLFLGSLSFIMSVAGCYSVKSKNRFFFIMFIATFVCLLILELTVAIIGFININTNVQEDVKSIMTSQITFKDTVDKANFHQVEKVVSNT
ncbi:hypothetical protein ILUMI_24400, partial [Ignelater luminosus]